MSLGLKHSTQQAVSLHGHLTETLKTTLSLVIHRLFPPPSHSLNTCCALVLLLVWSPFGSATPTGRAAITLPPFPVLLCSDGEEEAWPCEPGATLPLDSSTRTSRSYPHSTAVLQGSAWAPVLLSCCFPLTICPTPLLLCLPSSSHQPLLPAAWSGILSHCLSRVARSLGEHSCDTSSHPTLFACTGSTRAATQCQVCRPLSAPWELGLHARLPTQPMARA